jgi:hypothetical protein
MPMSYRVLIWTIAAVLLVVLVATIGLLSERRQGPIFVAANGPINEEQVRQK